MPKLNTKESILKSVNFLEKIDCYLVENHPLEELLFNRGLIGFDFTDVCYKASIKFIEHLYEELAAVDDISELMILSKGFYYKLHQAYSTVFKKNLQVNFIATKRNIDKYGNMNIDIPYSDISAKTSNVIIGDTIASGATICKVISHYLQYKQIENLYIVSYCGSKIGAIKISEFCEKKKIKLILLYGLAAFGLAENGFDLSFLHSDTITNQKYIDRAKKYYHGYPVSAVGVDFGTQSQSLKKYANLCSLEREYWNLGDDVFPFYDNDIDISLVEKEKSAFRKK